MSKEDSEDIDDTIREIQTFLAEHDHRELIFMARVGDQTAFLTGITDHHGVFDQVGMFGMCLDILADKQGIDLIEARAEVLDLIDDDIDSYEGFESNCSSVTHSSNLSTSGSERREAQNSETVRQTSK